MQKRIIFKSPYGDILRSLMLHVTPYPKALNVLSPTLKMIFLKHLWYLIYNVYSKKEIFRDVVRITKIRSKWGRSIYLLRYKEAWIVEKSEMDGSHGQKKITIILSINIKQVLDHVGKNNYPKHIFSTSEIQYAHRVIKWINNEDNTHRNKTRIQARNNKGVSTQSR